MKAAGYGSRLLLWMAACAAALPAWASVPAPALIAGNVSGQPGDVVRVPFDTNATALQIAALDVVITITPASPSSNVPLPTFPANPDLMMNPALEEPLAAVNDLGGGQIHIALTGGTGVDGPAPIFSLPVVVPNAPPGTLYRVRATGKAVNSSAEDVELRFIPGSIQVLGTQPPPSTDVVVSIQDVEAEPGALVKVPVLVNDAAVGVQGALLDIDFGTSTPADEPELILAGKPVAGTVFGRNALVIAKKQGTTLRVAVVQRDKGQGPGSLVVIPFIVPKGAEDGTRYSLSVHATLISNDVEEEVTTVGGTLEVVAPAQEPGDLDGNGIINLRDVIGIIMIVVLQKPVSDELLAVADVSGDGSVTLLDAVLLLREVAQIGPPLGWNPPAPQPGGNGWEQPKPGKGNQGPSWSDEDSDDDEDGGPNAKGPKGHGHKQREHD